jgi:hypothetical protein
LGFRDEGEVEHEFLHHLVAASVHGIGATGDEHGRALPGLFAPEPEARSPDPSASRLVARGAGFSLHADVLVCPYRGEKRKLTALLTDGKVVRRILEHLGLPTTVRPSPRHARPRSSSSPSTHPFHPRAGQG